ncbi:MAG: regulatory protein RecX [Gammaproteobacteria bacterium]|nr:MAG: regulatory protein RecX [Gammaproteobacteria bacterium]
MREDPVFEIPSASPAEPPRDGASDIEAAAIRLLAQREHSRHELEAKLARRFADRALCAQVLDDLEARGLLSDERFVEQYVGSRMRKGFGPLRIRAELREHGVADELIEAWLDLSTEEWLVQLRQVARDRFGEGRPRDARSQSKQARFLQYRGFPESLIRRYLWG